MFSLADILGSTNKCYQDIRCKFFFLFISREPTSDLQITAYKSWSAHAQCRPTIIRPDIIPLMRKWNHAFLLLAIALAWKWQIVSLLRRYSLKNKLVDRMTKLFSVNLYSCLCLTVFLGKSSVFSSVKFPPFSPAPAKTTKLTEPRSLGLLGWREICCISIYRIGEFQFSRVWLAPVTRNILGYSLFCDRSQDKFER